MPPAAADTSWGAGHGTSVASVATAKMDGVGVVAYVRAAAWSRYD